MTEAAKGSTSRGTFFELCDSTTGLPKTGIAYTDVTGSYVRMGAARTAITMATQTATGSFSSGGFVEIDGTNQPGVYRFDVPNAAFATGVEEMVVTVKATGCKTVSKGFVLTSWDKQVASIPAVAAGGSGGVLISGSNTGTTTFGAFTVTGALTATGGIAANITGNLVGTVSAVTLVNGLANNVITTASINDGAITAAKLASDAITSAKIADNAITAAKIASDAITAAKIADGAIDTATFASGCTIPRVTLADTITTYTGNTPQTGDTYASMAIIQTLGTINGGTPTTTSFIGSAGLSSVPDYYVGSFLFFTTGPNATKGSVVTAYNGTSKLLTFTTPFPSTPASGNAFTIMGQAN